MAGGEPQEKLPAAMTTELLMALDDYILKKPIQLCIVEKYLKNLFSRGQGGIGSEPYYRKNIKGT